MSEIPVENHVLYALRNATLKTWPYPHFYAENVFPDEFYWRMQDYLRTKSDYERGANNYNGRTFSSLENDFPELAFLQSPDFARHVTKLFSTGMKARFPSGQANLTSETRLVRDGKGYSIGPHTDAPWKVVSLLFYLPEDGWYARYGTAIYLPNDPTRRCAGGPHYKFTDFTRVYTAAYLPNTCFGFFKTANSFHGVEQLTEDFRRDILLYNLYDEELNLRSRKPSTDADPA